MENKQKFYLAGVILALTTEGEERSNVVNRVAQLAEKVFPELKSMNPKQRLLFFNEISSKSINASKEFAQTALEELENELGDK